MRIENFPPFEDFFIKAEESTKEALNENQDAIEILRCIYGTFQGILATASHESRFNHVLLLMSAMMTWLASVREASTGNHAAAMPLFRAALEAACYAYRIWEEPDLEDVWLNRYRDENARKSCRKIFTSAVRDTARNLANREFVWSGTKDWIISGYDHAIDFGAHPNSKSVLESLHIHEERTDGMVSVNLSGVYGGSSFQVKRMLVASIEYGQLITLIGSCCADRPEEQLLRTLDEINKSKEEFLAANFDTLD